MGDRELDSELYQMLESISKFGYSNFEGSQRFHFVTEESDFEFFSWIKKIADETQTPMPANIRIDRFPMEYSADPMRAYIVLDKEVKNFDLQINRTLMQILNINELQAVIEHEFTHVRLIPTELSTKLNVFLSNKSIFAVSRAAYVAAIFMLYKCSGLPIDLTGVEYYSPEFWMTIVNTLCVHDIAAEICNITSDVVDAAKNIVKNYLLRQGERHADLGVRNSIHLANALMKIDQFYLDRCEVALQLSSDHPTTTERINYLLSKMPDKL